MWVAPPITYLAVAPFHALPEIANLRKNRSSRDWMIFGFALLLLFPVIDGARYLNLVRAIGQCKPARCHAQSLQDEGRLFQVGS